MLVRLRNTGAIETEAIENIGEIPRELTKRVRLVYVGDFESMDGPVSVTEDHLKTVANAYNSKLAKFKRLAAGAVPVAILPPVQLDHTRSARDTVGRLENTDLVIEDWTDEEGETRKALYGNVRFLGRENVERVMDGRWSTLSLGADFERGKLEELSVTPFPAAERATVLSKPGTETKEENNKKESIMKLALYQRLRKHLKKKMSDEEVEEKMNKLAEEENEEELTKLAQEAEEEEKKDDEEETKKLSEAEEEKKKEKLAKLSAAKTQLTQLSTDFRSKRDAAQLAAKAASIGSRLSAIRSTGRITPAEVKKIDVRQLAGKSQEAIDAVLKSYEDRQPVILVGQLGSMKPMSLKDIDKVQKHVRLSQLEVETRKNMSLLRDTVPTKLAEGGNVGEQEGGEDKVSIHIDTDPHTDLASMEADYGELCSMMDGGKIQEVKDRLKGWMERMKKMGAYGMAEPTMHEQSMSQLTALQSDLDTLSAKFDEAMGLAESLASGE